MIVIFANITYVLLELWYFEIFDHLFVFSQLLLNYNTKLKHLYMS